MSMSILCHCSCNNDGPPALLAGQVDGEASASPEMSPIWPPSRQRELGLVSYSADLQQPLVGPPLRVGDVWHLLPEDGKSFEQATLSLHANGLLIKPMDGKQSLSIAWSPFSLVQACRLHSVQADAALPWLRLFKVSVFQYGSTHFFAAQGDEADALRARWVADISRALRVLTQSLFPEFSLRVEPLPGATWTSTRLLAGYLLLCDDQGVSLVYCELHSHWDCAATFAAYEDEYCDTQVVRLGIDMHTCVSERVGVDCSCFSFDGYHFTTRTCAEKMLWLRAISNVKVKLRHRAPNPSTEELKHYRESILEYAQGVRPPDGGFTRSALLPRRAPRRCHLPPVPGSGTSGPTGLNPTSVAPLTAAEGDKPDPGPGPAPTASRLQQLASPHKLMILIEPEKEGDDLPTLPPDPPLPNSGRSTNPEGAHRPASSLIGPVPAAPLPPTVSAALNDFARTGQEDLDKGFKASTHGDMHGPMSPDMPPILSGLNKTPDEEPGKEDSDVKGPLSSGTGNDSKNTADGKMPKRRQADRQPSTDK